MRTRVFFIFSYLISMNSLLFLGFNVTSTSKIISACTYAFNKYNYENGISWIEDCFTYYISQRVVHLSHIMSTRLESFLFFHTGISSFFLILTLLQLRKSLVDCRYSCKFIF